MGTETRIGIVTGLIIVVVASVYFFYGNEATEKDFLVSADTTASTPPTIPVSADKKRVETSPRPGPASGRHRSTTPRTSHRGKKVALGNTPRNKPRPSAATTPPQARPPVRLGDKLAINRGGNSTTPTYLRTSPADELRKATQDNINGQGSATTPDNKQTTINDNLPRNTEGRSPGTGFSPRPRSSNPEPQAPIVRSRRHTVAAGDTLSDISSRYFGNSGKVRDILAANPSIKNPHAIAIGDVLVIPAIEGNTATARNSRAETPVRDTPRTTQRTYRVQSGDTFYGIARRVYGDGTRWREIYRANTSLIGNDPKLLKPGMVLRVPE